MILFTELPLKSKPQGSDYFFKIAKLSGKKKIDYTNITATKIANTVEKGCSIIPFRLKLNDNGTFLNRKKENFIGTNWLFLDIDDKLTIQDTINRCNELNIQISILYPSFSHSKEKDKFRVGFKLKQDITDQDVYSFVWRLMTNLITNNTADEATKDAGSRLFYGTKYKSIIVDDNATVDLSEIFPDKIIELNKLTEENKDDFIINNGYGYKYAKQVKAKKKRIAKLNKEIEVYKNYTSQENYVKLDIMNKFETGEYDNLYKYDNFMDKEARNKNNYRIVYQLMLLYTAIGQENSFLKVVLQYYPEYYEQWENNINYVKTHFESIGSIYLNKWKEANAIKISNSESNFKTVNYYNTLYDVKHTLKEILQTEGLHLVKAPTGSGKTFTTINLFKELSKENKDNVYIILCPNRVQNQQNGKEYHIDIVIGGVDVNQVIRIKSAVYEKIKELVKIHRHMNIILVIDEAHELIGSIDYRNKAIENIDDCMKDCKTVIHMTATPRKLTRFYNYDSKTKFTPINKIYNIGTLNIIQSQKPEETLFSLLKRNKDNNKQSLVFISGSIKDIRTQAEVLGNKGFKVGVITSEDKQSTLYNSIVTTSIIPKEYEVVLATKVLECGTNIKNNNLCTIQVISNVNHFDLDYTEQSFARCRTYNDDGHIILKETTETKPIRTFFEIYMDLEERAKQNIEALNIIKSTNDINDVEWNEVLQGNIKSSIGAICGVGSIISYDPESEKLNIDYKRLVNRAFREYDKQFLYNIDRFKNVLKGHIKAKTIQIIDDTATDTKIKEEIKSYKKANKEVKKEVSNKAKETIKKIASDDIFKEYLYSNDKFDFIQQIRSFGIYEDIQFLELEEKELEKIKKLVNSHLFRDDEFKYLIAHYLKFNTEAELDRWIKHKLYEQQNMITEGNLPEIYTSYAVIRKHFDKVKNKQGRITLKAIMSLLQELYEKKLLWQFDKKHMQKRYKEFIESTDKEKKAKLQEKLFRNVLNELSLIYMLSLDEKGYRISSLK